MSTLDDPPNPDDVPKIDAPLRRKTLDEIRDSPNVHKDADIERGLDDHLKAIRNILATPMDPRRISNVAKMEINTERVILSGLAEIGISDETGRAIIENIKWLLGPGSRTVQ